ncbi:MAG TPA: hypothetical protein DCL41_04385 [Bdellovibrionales bacterium]|nr:hypothetical protein [Pseudobdellovibrionaceae bacterium]HAG91082.1 hypothetical protein [Bdellovibrionales bacterium]|tara:strand:+ start:393 stop:1262 length:870 start_codon:yes stop_codon:yes gene_type:complete
MADSQGEACPRCGNMSTHFYRVDTALKVALSSTGQGGDIPQKVCENCYSSLATNVSQGMKLRMEQEAREKNKVKMWKTRVNLVKHARVLMANKAYSEAAVIYEKYIRVLEIVYNLNRGELSPKVFNNSQRSKEMTVIASVYWDLVRIYDTSPAYGDRMAKAAAKLAEFLPFTTIYPMVVKKAEAFSKSAKNPAVIRQFLKLTKTSRGPCFLATAVFENEPYAVELMVFRKFRDQHLRTHVLGKQFIWAYYKMSPPLADWIRRRPFLKQLLRPTLKKLSLLLIKHLKTNE